jgi:hypothetical protein
MDHDPEIMRIAREHVAREHEIEPALAPRLRGSTLKELEQDAVRLRADLGLAPLHEGGRDERGRFSGGSSAMNRLIREKAGRA